MEKILASRPYRPLPPAEAKRRAEAWEVHAKTSGYWHGGQAPAAAAAEDAAARREAGPEYLVKWVSKAYWHCSWVPEAFLAARSKVKLKNFKLRRAQSNEVALGAESGDGEEEEYVIDPAWSQVDRVLSRRCERSLDGRVKDREVLVKWAGRDYEDCTWLVSQSSRPCMHACMDT